MAVLAASLAVLAPASAASAQAPGANMTVTLAFLPAGTDPVELDAVEGLSPGLMSAGLAKVPAEQTYLDIGQGNRVFDSLYDGPLPRLFTVRGRVPPVLWRAVLDRARSAPADIVPGLLATTIERERGFAAATALAG
ncbi:MAG: hypothetical protein ACRDL3_05185, partial [Solirubrobacterales bacterium]